jgi:hypothetical protein
VGDAAGKAFFSLNKWHGFLLYFCQILLLLYLSPPAYRGGVERGVAPAFVCRDRGGKGDSISKHKHVAGCCAAAIFSRQGGMSSTSSNGGPAPAPSRVIEPYLPRSDPFPAAEWGTVVAASRRQEAPEQLVSDPRRFRLEDAGEG